LYFVYSLYSSQQKKLILLITVTASLLVFGILNRSYVALIGLVLSGLILGFTAGGLSLYFYRMKNNYRRHSNLVVKYTPAGNVNNIAMEPKSDCSRQCNVDDTTCSNGNTCNPNNPFNSNLTFHFGEPSPNAYVTMEEVNAQRDAD
jgi:hypothetical protein